MTHDVFISHSSKDANTALAVCGALESAGIRCWLAPRNIPGGAIWAEAILAGIAGARVQVVVFSSHANRSSHVLNEIDAAVRKGLVIVPFRIEDVAPAGAMEFHLQSRHWLDALTPPLETHIAALRDTVSAILERPLTGGSPSPARPSWWTGLQTSLGRAISRHRRGAIVGVLVMALMVIGLLARGGTATEFDWKPDGRTEPVRVRTRALHLFEASRAAPPLDRRVYTDEFRSDRTRYIYAQLDLAHASPGEPGQLPIACSFVAEDGTVEGAVSSALSVGAEDTLSHWAMGWGRMMPGRWTPGRYRTECRHGERVVGVRSFKVVAPPEEAVDIPALNATVTGMKFFEAGARMPPASDRLFAERFSVATTRFVYFQLELAHRPPGRELSVTIDCTYWAPDNTKFYESHPEITVQPEWRNSRYAHGSGWSEQGRWKSGRYRVECEREGRLLASSSFEIVAPSFGRIPVLDGEVTGLRFFESGRTIPPVAARVYRTRFGASAARYLNFEVSVSHQAAGRDITVPLQCEYLRDGKRLALVETRPIVPASRAGSSLLSSGWGRETPGFWTPGTVMVICRHAGREIARASFDVQ